jgi:hypothetical protein
MEDRVYRRRVGYVCTYVFICVDCCLGGNHTSVWSAAACMHACHATVISHTSLPLLYERRLYSKLHRVYLSR